MANDENEDPSFQVADSDDSSKATQKTFSSSHRHDSSQAPPQRDAVAVSICNASQGDSGDSSPIISRGENSNASIQGDRSIDDIQSSQTDINGSVETPQHKGQNSLQPQNVRSRHGGWPNSFLLQDSSSQHLEVASSGFIRQPCYNIPSSSVCFQSNHHPGTMKWLEVVTEFVDNTDEFPDWDDAIPSLIQIELAKEGITHFLVFLNIEGHQPCTDITEGSWFFATDEEISQYTREKFFTTIHVD